MVSVREISKLEYIKYDFNAISESPIRHQEHNKEYSVNSAELFVEPEIYIKNGSSLKNEMTISVKNIK